jgi:NAD(P)-dependent dehydrogenase (short-subunit alcohol dehydrogenase family)
MSEHEDTYLVTGGARRIGAAICERFAARGDRVVVADHDQEGERLSPNALAANSSPVDLRDRTSVAPAVAASIRIGGRLATVVDCAGVTKYADIFDITDDGWQWMMNINAVGTTHVIQAAGTAGDVTRQSMNVDGGLEFDWASVPAAPTSRRGLGRPGGQVVQDRVLATVNHRNDARRWPRDEGGVGHQPRVHSIT